MINKKPIDHYSNIIWDWNGTLLNDINLCVDIVNKLLVNHNDLQLSKDHYKDVFGFPITEYYRKIGMDFEKESFENLTKKFIASYDSYVKQCQLHKNALEVLKEFDQTKSNQFILTAAHKASVLELLDHYAIRKYFKAIEGLDNHRAESKVERGKQLIKNNHIDRSNTVLIGDTNHDFEVADAIGIDCILISNGHQSRKRLEDSLKDKNRVLNEVGELITMGF